MTDGTEEAEEGANGLPQLLARCRPDLFSIQPRLAHLRALKIIERAGEHVAIEDDEVGTLA